MLRLPAGANVSQTTTPIAFDAVAKVDDERSGSAGTARREGDGDADLSTESLEAKLRALPNVRLANLGAQYDESR